MASTVRSRRRATAIAVPGTVAVLLAGAFAAAPALAASSSPALPFPSICPTGQSAPGAGSAVPGPSTSTKAATSAAASASAGRSTAPATSAAPSASTSQAANTTVSTSASPSSTSSSAASSGSGGGFWGWLNGVWTWIFSDSPQTSATPAAEDAVAPLSAAHVVAAAAALGEPESAATTAPNCVSAAKAAALAAAASASPSEGVTAGTIPWVMKTSEMSMWNLTYNGVKSVQVWNPTLEKYTDENVLDFTGSELTIQSMVTYSVQNGQTVYNDAGTGTTTTLIDPHLMVVTMTADLYGLLGQTYDPDNPPPLPVGVPVPIVPVIFTNVTSVNAYLITQSIQVPGFNGFASPGAASPQ